MVDKGEYDVRLPDVLFTQNRQGKIHTLQIFTKENVAVGMYY